MNSDPPLALVSTSTIKIFAKYISWRDHLQPHGGYPEKCAKFVFPLAVRLDHQQHHATHKHEQGCADPGATVQQGLCGANKRFAGIRRQEEGDGEVRGARAAGAAAGWEVKVSYYDGELWQRRSTLLKKKIIDQILLGYSNCNSWYYDVILCAPRNQSEFSCRTHLFVVW